MAAEWVAKLFDIGKLPSRIVALAAVVTGMLLFSSATFTDRFRLTPLVKQYGQWIGLAFVVSFGLLFINTLLWVGRKIAGFRTSAARSASVAKNLEILDHEEKAVLREFSLHGQNTVELPIDYPAVVGLVTKGIVESVSDLGRVSSFGRMFPMRLTPAAGRLLTSQHIGLPGGEPSQETLEWAIKNRPGYTRRRW